MAWLSKIFGGGDKAPDAAASETYEGFDITPTPMKESQGYRIAATIIKTVDGVEKSHKLVRADTINDYEGAIKASIGKAKQMIDEQGDRLFG